MGPRFRLPHPVRISTGTRISSLRDIFPSLGHYGVAQYYVIVRRHSLTLLPITLRHEITNYYPCRFLRTRRYKYLRNCLPANQFPFAADLYVSYTWEGIRNSAGGDGTKIVLGRRYVYERAMGSPVPKISTWVLDAVLLLQLILSSWDMR